MTLPYTDLLDARVRAAQLGRDDIPAYVRQTFGVTMDAWQADVADAVRDALHGTGKSYIAVRSGHGVGKGMTVAMAVLTVLLCYTRVKIVCIAPTAAQAFDSLFAEIMMHFRNLPKAVQDEFDTRSDRIELKVAPEECFLSVRTASRDRPEGLQGIHAEHVLLVADEASGIDEAVFEASGGSMSGRKCCMLLLGNPTRVSGYFHAAFNKPGVLERFVKFRVNGEDSPRVSRDFIEQIAALYGRESDQYRVRVLGEFPSGDADTLISRDLVVFARARDIFVPDGEPRVWGLDPARFGDDSTGLVERTSRSVVMIDSWAKSDLMATVGRIKDRWDGLPERYRPRMICVDPIGVGGGVVDRLKELGLPVRAVNVTESPVSPKARGYRLRDELAWQMREWFGERTGTLKGLTRDAYERLEAQLVVPRYSFSSDGRVKLESKVEMKKRGQKSPDLFDALALTFAPQAVAAMSGAMLVGSGWGRSGSVSREVAAVL